MAIKKAGSYISIDQSSISTKKSTVQQLVDIVQTDIAAVDQSTRKSYEVFTSGGLNLSSITSSLYQTVHDQEFTLGTANPLFDISIGSLLETVNDNLVVNEVNSGITRDSGGKLVFTNSANQPMMREKINIYRQFAQNLLGDADASFITPHTETAEDVNFVAASGTLAKKIRGAIFICFRRLFTRDNMYKGSFGLRLHKRSSKLYSDFLNPDGSALLDKISTGLKVTNLDAEVDSNTQTNEGNAAYFIDDLLGTTNIIVSPVSGDVSTLKDTSGNHIGLIYYKSGIIVLDCERVFDATQIIRGLIDSTRSGASSITETSGPFIIYGHKSSENSADDAYHYPVFTNTSSDHSTALPGFLVSGSDGYTASSFFHAGSDTTSGASLPSESYPLWSSTSDSYYSDSTVTENDTGGDKLFNGTLYPNLWVSGTVDEVIDHVCKTRFGRGNLSAITFRNETVINSSLIFCRAAPSQLNYSTNPTYTNDDGNIIATSSNQDPFSYITTVGLYDTAGDLLAVAKSSRPIEKNPETDLSIRIRLDY